MLWNWVLLSGFTFGLAFSNAAQANYTWETDNFSASEQPPYSKNREQRSIKLFMWNVYKFSNFKNGMYCDSQNPESIRGTVGRICKALLDSDIAMFQEALIKSNNRKKLDNYLATKGFHIQSNPIPEASCNKSLGFIGNANRGNRSFDSISRIDCSTFTEHFAAGIVQRDRKGMSIATLTRSVANRSKSIINDYYDKVPGSKARYKGALLTWLELPEGEELLLINVHNTLFGSIAAYENLLSQIDEHVRNHSGPIIFGGDFNTTSEARFDLVMTYATGWGMIRLPFHSPFWFNRKQLDHLFVRGLRTRNGSEVQVLPNRGFDGSLSDHNAISVELIY